MIGLGPIGLFTVAVLHARGMGPVIGVDPVDDRRRLALPDCALGGEQSLRRGPVTRSMERDADKRFAARIDLHRRQDAGDARRSARLLDVDGN